MMVLRVSSQCSVPPAPPEASRTAALEHALVGPIHRWRLTVEPRLAYNH
jgi:hypothetical protein